jgi:WD40 repeat protein
MENVNQPAELTAANERALRKLARSITQSQGNFTLILVRCNHCRLREEMVQRLQDLCQPLEFTKLSLPSSVKTLYTTIQTELEQPVDGAMPRSPAALLVFGLDSVVAVDHLLIATNQVREEFRQHFPFPLVLWMNDALLQKWIQLAPDFKSWAATPIKFETSSEPILQAVESAIADVFTALLQLGAGRFQTNPDSPLSRAERQFQELEPALEEIRPRLSALPSSLEADIQFLKGREADIQGHKPQAKHAYEHSLELWQQHLSSPTPPPSPTPTPSHASTSPSPPLHSPLPIPHSPLPITHYPLPITAPLHLACVQFHLGLWWRQLATQHQADCTPACLQAKEYYQQCIQTLQTAQRPDLAARFINALGEVQIRLIQQVQLDLQAAADSPVDLAADLPAEARATRPTLVELWQDLERIAQATVQLHEAANSAPIRRAYGYALQAEVALHQSQATEAKRLAELALHTNDQPLAGIESIQSLKRPLAPNIGGTETIESPPILGDLGGRDDNQSTVISPSGNPPETESEIAADWQVEQQQYRGLYLLLLAQAQRLLGQTAAAITNLETARTTTDPQFNPLLYIRILTTLQAAYFDQGSVAQEQKTQSSATLDPAGKAQKTGPAEVLGQEPQSPYWQAFLCKQEQRSIEQQYGLRAFVGAGRLQPRRAVLNPALGNVEQATSMSQEMAASGRMQDITRLVERIGRADHKLTVIYGQSGVGKSSLVQAGLIPVLQQQMVEARDVLPVLLQVYSDWEKKLGGCYAESLAEIRGLQLPGLLDSMQTFLSELRQNRDRNLLTVLIFDQFEEFFFAYRDSLQRRPFFEFLRDCLNIPFVKIILSLREDYLHYLLECNRLTHLDAIENNILDKKILYYLGNFSPADAQAVITRLIETSQLRLEPRLVTALVQDLAGELGEVRPIELQVVGAQLQTERISTLAQYQQHGPKEALVGRFLEEVVQDCGPENASFTKIILYLLTDENNTRPLKTQAELEADLSLPPERFQLILHILVKSGLVFLIPGFPTTRYQLVHDYLVPFIRQQQAATLVAELEKEREQRKLTEAKLNQALKKQLKTARRATWTLGALLTGIGSVALVAIVVGINLYLANQFTGGESRKQDLDKVVQLIKVTKLFKQLSVVVIPGLKLKAFTALSQVVSTTPEINRLEGHTGSVTSISFSPDGQLLASVSEDKTVKIWKLDGQLLNTLKGHTARVTHVSFSTDSKLIASASEDRTIKIWRIGSNEPLRTLSGNRGTVTSTSFSPDGNMLASGGEDNLVRRWNLLNGKELLPLRGHQGGITSVSFSPDGSILASADRHDGVKLWRPYGKPIQTITNYGTISIGFSRDSKALILANRDKSIRQYTLDGVLTKNIGNNSYNEGEIIVSAFSPDNKLQAFVDRYSRASITLTPTEYYRSMGNFSGHSDDTTDLKFSPDGTILASASKDKTIKLWDVQPQIRQVQISESGWEELFRNIQFSPNGHTIGAQKGDQTIQLFDKQKQQITSLIGNFSILKFSPNSQMLVSSSSEDNLKLWSLDGKELSLRAHAKGVTSVRLSPDGKTIVSVGRDGMIKFWRHDGVLLKQQVENSKDLAELQYSPDSQLVTLVNNQSNSIKLWRRDGTLVRHLIGHTSKITTLLFSPNSQLLVSISTDNLIRLWHRDGRLIQVLQGHPNRVEAIRFSPNSQLLASVSNSPSNRSEIKLWTREGKIVRSLVPRRIWGSRYLLQSG